VPKQFKSEKVKAAKFSRFHPTSSCCLGTSHDSPLVGIIRPLIKIIQGKKNA